ncbi:MAG: sensor hybrid histidine kinase [Actinomycetia bacterium]|nr:sensor hybrid histidine kinase [Actinomycetes bacterium]MDQ1654604.1 hypothetical protein [Cryptosporangiaceae bacterium]
MSPPVHLLVVEDNDDDAVLVVDRLRRSGLTVDYQRVETLDGVTAALAAETLPDVLLCDYNLPSLSAESVLGLLHERELDIPFILVSGQIGEESAAALMRAGAHDFVLKDRLARLAPAIQRELREAEIRRERRQGQAALRESEERFRLLAEHAQDIIFRCRLLPHAEVEYLSPAVTAITGYEPEELMGDPARLFKTVAPDDEHVMEESWRSPSPDLMLLRWRRRNGDSAWMEQRAAGIRDADGRLVAVQGVLRDVTERVRAEHDHAAMRVRLHQAQRLESLGQLAGGVAHDFNNLLGVILGFTAFVSEEITSAAASDTTGRWAAVREDVGRITHAAERAAALTQQLLVFGRREVVQPRALYVNASVAAVEQLLRRTVGKDAKLVTDLADDLWPVWADLGQIEQVLLNLAVNARDAMPGGDGTLTIRTRNIEIDPTMAASRPGLVAGRHVQLQVIDTGTGMPPEIAERAFEPFFTTKAKGSGTGLGLATVYGIVTQGGGSVQVESSPGQGTTFTILLPATDEVPAVDETVVPAAPVGTGQTVLLVEDEPALLEVTRRHLIRAGYQVLAASGGAEALAMIAGHDAEIHLLLTDVLMPEMLGKEVAERFLAQRPGTPVLFMSGYVGSALTSQGRLDPGVSLLEKPFAAAELIARVSQLLAAERAPRAQDGA